MLIMALFSSVFRRLFEHFAHFLHRRETSQCAAQDLEKLPDSPLMKAGEKSEAFDFTANDRKCRKRHRKVPERCQQEEKEVKINKGGSHKDEAEKERETLRLEHIKMKKNGRVHQRKRKMQSLEKLMEGGSEHREAGERPQITEPTPLLVEVKPLHTPVGSSFLKPIEGELPMLPSVSEHLAVSAARFKPLPLVTKPPVHLQKPSEDVLFLLHVDPPKLLVVPPHPTPAPDELFSLRRSSSQVRPPAPDEAVALRRPPSRKPQPFTSSPFEPPPQLMLVDIEDEENEYVEYTGKTFRAGDLLKPERPQTPEAEMKPRKMVAWLEKDSEAQEEARASEVEEIQGFEEEDPSEMGDSEAKQGHTSPDSPNNVNVQEGCKRKLPIVLFTWIQVKAKKKEVKKIQKEKERRENELLFER